MNYYTGVFKKFILFCAALLTASSSIAGTYTQNILINHDVRPTPAEIMSDQQNFSDIDPNVFPTTVAYKQDIPTVIVALEKAFPGGTYAFLGRDMDLVADAVEAFYLSIGQKDRVKRIRFSTPSMLGATPGLITNFLIQSGLNANPNVHKPPMVIVDYTSYGRSSQSTMLLESTLRELENRGIKPSDALTRLNIATIHSKPSVRADNIIALPIETVVENIDLQNHFWATEHSIKNIMQIPVSNIAYGSEWHGKYGPIIRKEDGTLETRPETTFPYTHKEDVFKGMAAAIMTATTEEFKNSVTELAIKNSVHIAGLKTPAVVRPVPKTAEQREQDAKELLKQKAKDAEDRLIKELDLFEKHTAVPVRIQEYRVNLANNEAISVTLNAYYFLGILKANSGIEIAHYHRISLESLLKLKDKGKIEEFDVPRVLMAMLQEARVTDPEFVEHLQANYKENPLFENALGKFSVREKYLHLNGIAGDNFRLLTNHGTLPLSCKLLLLNN